MRIELLARWVDTESETDKEDERIRRLVEGEEAEPKAVKFVYEPIVMDTKDIKNFNRLDEEHTTIRLYPQESYVVKLPYDIFKEVFEAETGQVIKSIYVSPFLEGEGHMDDDDDIPPMPKKSPRKPRRNDTPSLDNDDFELE